MNTSYRWILCAALVACLGVPAFATALDEGEADLGTVDGHDQLLSLNPFGYVFEWYNVEYEHRLSPSTSLGFTASYATPDDDSLATGNAIFRFYPQGRAFQGFYIGGRSGAYYVNDFDDNGIFFGAGVEIGYTWLLGENDNWYIGIGAGVTRIFGGDLDGSALLPQVRLINFGYSF